MKKYTGPRTPSMRRIQDRPVNSTGDITAVIPCHNYEHYLFDCLESIEQSTLRPVRVIVIDDASRRPIRKVCSILKPEVHRVEFKDQGRTCRFGFEMVKTKYVMFPDADDKIHPKYLQDAVAQLEHDRQAACVFPHLIGFGDRQGVMSGTDKAPTTLGRNDLEARNWCPSGSLFRTDVLRQSLAMSVDRVQGCGCNDWITIRNVVRAGSWHALKSPHPLYYRIHQGQMHTGTDFKTYALQADLANETVTIVVAFSGRWKQWVSLREWIKYQTWPQEQTRVLILNSTHTPVTVAELGLNDLKCKSLQVERVDAGFPKLAEANRVNDHVVCQQVNSAVAGLYNRAVQAVYGEWIMFVEDDVIPHRLDAIEKLMTRVDHNVAGITGKYPHRYERDKTVAFKLKSLHWDLLPMEGPETENVAGSGFGCLLARRSVLSRYALSGDSNDFYDVDIGKRVTADGWKWILDRDVTCDHLTQ